MIKTEITSEYQRILSDLKISKNNAIRDNDLIKLSYLNDIKIWHKNLPLLLKPLPLL